MRIQIPNILLVIFLIIVTPLTRGIQPDRMQVSKRNLLNPPPDDSIPAGHSDNRPDTLWTLGNDKLLKSSAYNQFKQAYQYYQAGQYQSSAKSFQHLYKELQYLTEYSHFFYIKSLWHTDRSAAMDAAQEFITKYNKHALADSLTIPLADAFFESGNFKKARTYYSLAQNRKITPELTIYAQIQAGHCLYRSGSQSQALDEFYQIMKKYTSQEAVLELAEFLIREQPKFYQEHFFTFVEVYFSKRRFSTLQVMLEKFIKAERDGRKKEKARFYIIRIYLAQNRHKTALYGFFNLLDVLQDKNLEPHIRLNIARAYYNMGNKRNAIESYLDYAKRYPRRRIAPETVWKAAWIYEELNEPENALELYRDLRKRWPSSKYTREAFFREGFTLYRLGQYEAANAVFTEIRTKRWPDVHINRASYWSAMSREVLGDSVTARQLQLDLAKHLWDDYYTMRSYLVHKSYLDSTWNMIREFKQSANALQYYGSGMTKLINHFEQAFQVRELLGETYGLMALSDIRLVASTWEEWMALAEIYKKLGAYNKAYRVYDFMNSKFFGHQSFTEKPFMIKERFPLYYDDLVDKYSHRYNLEPEFILAVIKQESVFDPQARSWANAHGLMQLMPLTARDMAQLAGMNLTHNNQLLQAEVSIHLGSLYMKQLHRRFNGYKEWMLAAYNAGPHRVMRWREIPGSEQVDVFIENIEFSETRDYVRKVMKNYWAYRLLNNNFNIEKDDIIFGVLDTNQNQPTRP